MRTILCLIGVATLFLTSGCIVHERGGYYGSTEYERGTYHQGHRYRSYDSPYRRYDRGGYWDENGFYHAYRRPLPESRGQHYNYGWEDRRY